MCACSSILKVALRAATNGSYSSMIVLRGSAHSTANNKNKQKQTLTVVLCARWLAVQLEQKDFKPDPFLFLLYK